MDKGLTESEADMVVTRVSANKERFLEDMLANELHIHRSHLEKPYKVGLVIGLSFLLGALVPLLPYYLDDAEVLLGDRFGDLLALVPLRRRAWKGRIVGREIWRSGLETLHGGGGSRGDPFRNRHVIDVRLMGSSSD